MKKLTCDYCGNSISEEATPRAGLAAWTCQIRPVSVLAEDAHRRSIDLCAVCAAALVNVIDEQFTKNKLGSWVKGSWVTP